MKKYAQVIVDNNSIYTDNFFTYEIPDDILDQIKIGHRVLVPFGKSNKPIQGFIFDILDENEEHKNTKKIIDILDEEPLLRDVDIKIIKWMKDEYLCKFIEAIDCIYPKGYRVNTYKVIHLVNNNFTYENLRFEEKKIIDEILKHKGKISLDKLKKNIKSNIDSYIKKLREKRIIQITWESKSIKNEKYVYSLRLNIQNSEVENTIQSLNKKRSFKQAQIISFLANKEKVLLDDLIKELKVTKSSIKSLQEKDLIKIEKIDYFRKIETTYKIDEKEINLNQEQIKAVNILKSNIQNESKKPFLLHGVTGSGKTEVYIKIIQEMLSLGKDSIVLVPEISLTPQTIARFKNRFNDTIALLHSRLSDGQRQDEYKRIKQGKAKIVIGARSAIFAPCKDLGIVIIDEFHESSYKSETSPKYNTIEVAKKLCEETGSILLLGSATPSIDEYYKCEIGEYNKIELKNRANNKQMPPIEVIDMKEELNNGNKSIFSRALYEAIDNNLVNKTQTILFLNRRGYANFISCRKCSYLFKCSSCDISLTYHKYKNIAKCHYCGYEVEVPKKCPSCDSLYLKEFGIGTEKIEEEIKKYFPNARVLRMDRDTTSKKGSHEDILNKFKNGQADILIGTQMISKGLDFPNVTLVGILSADMMLNFPDFKSSEKTFQIINQVAGRAGRDLLKGRVILQTYDTEHYSIRYAKNYDYLGFYNEEIKIRKIFNYKPFNSLISVVVFGKNEKSVIKNIQKIYDAVIYVLNKKGINNFQFILGPNPCPISKINNNYRWQILFKDLDIEIKLLKGIIKYICIEKRDFLLDSDVSLSIDTDPESIL
ncbi:replication restart DNA helicase PriA [Alkalithermobacter thermoalcaliphilus JW-YL-7 = DSM 7308]|uniref:Replication restart protein PriA n=2 Tax=Clostridium paradoxum TaxID=29346 RepID=A0A150FPQ2_CLOPD|nr:primosomal protein N [[Clostridium] paradoxum JW-YL-7 = DSM 7308]SHK96568.1 replication restart DNA helicase PriA [[Clostridium] paradoxum JW-YL-7 = DSM 7308]